MKIIKKVAIFMMTICLLIPCFSLVSFAADGKIMFTDPTCKTGETVEVKVVVQKLASTMGKIQITMTYDTSKLRFNSGNGVTESASGVITYQGDATSETGNRKEFVIKFDALQVGTAEIKIQSATIKNVQGTTMDYTKGSSKVTISQGEDVDTPPVSSTEAVVDVDGKNYKFADTVPESEIPEGYTETTLNYDTVDYNVIYSETTGLYLAYLLGEDNVGDLFLYVEENATFVPYEAIKISDNTTIVLLSEVEDVMMPNEYKETKVIVNDFEFPAWQNSDTPEFCVIYAMGSNGVKSLYQLDNTEGTYQRFTPPEIVPEEKETWITKLSDVLTKHMDKVILGAGFGFLLFVMIIVILSIKLYNRNVELDMCYDELDAKDAAARDDDYDDDDDYESEKGTSEEEPSEMEMLVQEGMKEVFPVEEAEEPVIESEVETTEETEEESMQDVIEESPEKEESVATLSEALEQQKKDEKQESSLFDEDDEILLEDFSVDFIDLEDDDE